MRNRVGLLTTSATASINVNKFLPRSMGTISKNASSKKDFVGAPWLQQRQLVTALNQVKQLVIMGGPPTPNFWSFGVCVLGPFFSDSAS